MYENNSGNGVRDAIIDFSQDFVTVSQNVGEGMITLSQAVAQGLENVGRSTGDTLGYLANAVSYSTETITQSFTDSGEQVIDLSLDSFNKIVRSSSEAFQDVYDVTTYVVDDATRLLLGGGKDLLEGTANTAVNLGDTLIGKPLTRLNKEASTLVRNIAIFTFTICGVVLFMKYKDE